MAIIMSPEQVKIVRCYDKKESPPDFEGDIGNETSRTEIFMLKDNGNIVHKRPEIRFIRNWASNDNVVSRSQRRTYGVENIVNPGSLSRSGYIFKGWARTRGSSTPMTFPRTVPSTTEYQDFVDYGYAIWEEADPTTAKPTVGTPTCVNYNGTNEASVKITNNQDEEVTIKNGKFTLGTLNASSSGTFTIESGFKTPYDYSLSITAKASGYNISPAVTKTGRINVCALGH